MTPHSLAVARESIVCAVYLKTTADRKRKEALFSSKPNKTMIDFLPSTNPKDRENDYHIDRNGKQDTDNERPSSTEKQKQTSRVFKKKTQNRTRNQATKMTKILMTSNKNLNRIDTFYYENPKNKAIYPETATGSSQDKENSADDENESEERRPPRSPLNFIRRPRRDKSYYLSNTVQIQCDMSDTDPESEPGETATETEESEEEIVPTPTPTPEPPKEKPDPNVIHLNEDDALIRLIFKNKESPKKKSMTLFEKQRLVLKSLYDIRRSRLNNLDVRILLEYLLETLFLF